MTKGKIIAAIVIMIITAIGLKMGLNTGAVVVLIAALGVVAFLLMRLQKQGKISWKGVIGGVVHTYDPTLPSILDAPTGAPGGSYDEYARGYGPTIQYPAPSQQQPMSPEQSPQTQRLRTQIAQIQAPPIQGALNPGMPGMPPTSYAPSMHGTTYPALPEAHPYELCLGNNAYVAVQHLLRNTLILDPTNNSVRVIAEELARMGIPLLFVDITPEGLFTPLLKEFPLGRRICGAHAGETDAQAIPLSHEMRDEALHVGRTILQESWQTLFQLSTFQSPMHAAVTLWDVIAGMVTWERGQQQRTGRVLPCVIFFSDAYRICPQLNKHSLFRDVPETAQMIRQNTFDGLREADQTGVYWHLATKSIASMDQQILRQCSLWMMRNPTIAEIHSGWISAYTGLEPGDLQNIPPTRTLIFDTVTRNPHLVELRQSHSQAQMRRAPEYSLPPLPIKASLPPTIPLPPEIPPPFQQR